MKNRKNLIKALLVFLCITSCAAVYFAADVYRVYFRPNIKNDSTAIFVKKGTSPEELADMVTSADILKNSKSFRTIVKRRMHSNVGISGMYRFKKDADNRFILNSVLNGWQTPCRLTLSGNIRTLEKLSGIIGRQIEADSAAVLAAFKDSSLIAGLGFTTETAKVMVIPETYEIYWNIPPESLVRKLHSEWEKFWNSERRDKAQRIRLTPVEVSILASIVAEESNLASEQPLIAGVYLNRLKAGIPLQADPTVKYATGDPTLKRILYKHLETESPYNTYLHRGLPPGPITIPSVQAIDAVLNYEDRGYYYFCASPELDGTHRFAKTISEHGRNAARYRQAIDKLNL